MHMIIIGCEYAGKTTLAEQISWWMIRTMGLPRVRWHAHFMLPHVSRDIVMPAPLSQAPVDEDEEEAILALRPSLKEKLMRYMIWRHLYPDMYRETDDYLLINFYYAEAVYAPLYYGYGGPEHVGRRDRRWRARAWDAEVMAQAPDTMLVLVRASADAILQRMRQNPRPRCILKEQDVPVVLERFEEEYANSLILRRIALDTTGVSAMETFAEFLRQMRPYFTQADRQRILIHQTLQQAER